jgi:hypothetical protein
LMLALGWDMRDVDGSLSASVSMALICGAAIWRDCGEEEGPPVTTRFPFAV